MPENLPPPVSVTDQYLAAVVERLDRLVPEPAREVEVRHKGGGHYEVVAGGEVVATERGREAADARAAEVRKVDGR